MISKRLLLPLSLLLLAPAPRLVAQRAPKRPGVQPAAVHEKDTATLKRKDSFFGLHFDFHALPDDEHVGRTLSYGMIDTLLSEARPDFIQVDCKGHPGISSYPTRVGTPVKSFDKDPLQLWRAVTRKHHVALYVHYSGVYEKQAVKLHPGWAALDARGKMDSDKISVHSPYVDELMIPQLQELSKDYGIDGVWVDGDCWATVPDYSPAALAAFRAKTGMHDVPHAATDSGYEAFLNFNRQSFLDYVQHYASAMHRFNPDFQVASNWAFSSFMPRPVTIDVDFLSGDLTPVNSLNNAAFEGRCLASQGQASGKPWDIMSWGFTLNWEKQGLQTKKSAVQLEQEAAEIISLGGGFQCYFTQNRDASIKPWEVPTMKALGDFVRARRQFCKGSLPVPQIAVLYSGATHEREIRSVFTNDKLERIKGISTALLDGQQALEIKMEHQLHGAMRQYPLIVIPEWDWLPDSLRNELLAYVSDGGNLLVIGAAASRLFEKEAGIRLAGDPVAHKLQYLGYNQDMAAIEGSFQPVDLLAGTQPFGKLYEKQDLRAAARPAASIARYGKGRIACVFADLGENYEKNTSALERSFINALVRELFPRPVVSVSGSHLVHITVNRLGTKQIIHLINTGGQHANRNFYSYDEVPPLGPLKVRIRMSKPARLVLQPENKPLPFTYQNGELILTIPSLKIHSMIVAG